MNRKAIVDYLFKNIDYTKDAEKNKELIQAIEEARKEMERASQYFEAVSSPQLVDYAIHLENAARARFMYLLNQAKESGIKVDTKISVP